MLRIRQSEVITMQSFRALFGAFIVTAVAAVTGVVVLSAFASWWALFALFSVPPLLMMVGGVAMMTARGRPIAAGCVRAGPCGPWSRSDRDHATPLR
jgi:hypothetical protein